MGGGEPEAVLPATPEHDAPRRLVPWALVVATFVFSLQFYWRGPETDWRTILDQSIGTLVAFAGLAIAHGRDRRGWSGTLLGPPKREWLSNALTLEASGLLASVVCIAIAEIALHRLAPSAFGAGALASASEPTPPAESLPAFVREVILAPLCEEALVRGLLLGALSQRMPAAFAVLLSAAVFGIAHPAFSPQFMGGVVYGWIVLRSGSLWPAVFAHAFGNILVAPLFVSGLRLSLLATQAGGSAQAVLLAALLVLMLLIVSHTLAMATGRRAPGPAGRGAILAVVVGASVGMVGASGGTEQDSPGEVASFSLFRQFVCVVRSTGESVSLQGRRIPFALEAGDSVSLRGVRQERDLAGAAELSPVMEIRAMLAGEPRQIELAFEDGVRVRSMGARTYRFMRWLSEDDQGAFQLGPPGRMLLGPERRSRPLRVIEARMAEDWPLSAQRAHAIAWVPVGRTCWHVTVGVVNPAEVPAVLEALDRRIAQAHAKVQAAVAADTVSASRTERTVLLSDLGRVPVAGRAASSRAPWVLLGAVTMVMALSSAPRAHGPEPGRVV